MSSTAVLGLPRMGPDRELRFALESYWAEKTSEEELAATARGLRTANWKRAAAAGIDVIPCAPTTGPGRWPRTRFRSESGSASTVAP